jgi:hypothetical protein
MPSCLAKGETANQKSDPSYREREHRAKNRNRGFKPSNPK